MSLEDGKQKLASVVFERRQNKALRVDAIGRGKLCGGAITVRSVTIPDYLVIAVVI